MPKVVADVTDATESVVAFPEARVSLRDAWLRSQSNALTRTAYRTALDAFESFLGRPLTDATRRDVEAFRASLEARGRAPATITKTLAALSSFYAYALSEDAVSRSPVAAVRRPKVSDRSSRMGIEPHEARAMLAAVAGDDLRALRDRALLTALSLQGWRLFELLGLTIETLGWLQGHRVAEIRGKGGRVVPVPLAAPTVAALEAWTTRAEILSGPVFLAVRGSRVLRGKALSEQAADKRIKAIAKQAGITRTVHAHLFRHGAVTAALRQQVPLHKVQDFARHADPRTTRRYDSDRESLENPTTHVLAGMLLPGGS